MVPQPSQAPPPQPSPFQCQYPSLRTQFRELPDSTPPFPSLSITDIQRSYCDRFNGLTRYVLFFSRWQRFALGRPRRTVTYRPIPTLFPSLTEARAPSHPLLSFRPSLFPFFGPRAFLSRLKAIISDAADLFVFPHRPLRSGRLQYWQLASRFRLHLFCSRQRFDAYQYQ